MAQSFRQIKNRIRSVQNTEKVTNAMQMISVSKLNRMDDILFRARPYLSKLELLLNNLLCGVEIITNPYFEKRLERKKTILCVVTSDSGLCGPYNNNIIHLSEQFLKDYAKDKIDLFCVGEKGFSYFKKRGFNIIDSCLRINGKFSTAVADKISADLSFRFLSRHADEVFVAYTGFVSALIHKPTVKKILNIEPREAVKIDYIVEPSIEKIMDALTPRYISTVMRLILLESFTSEHAARTVAMKMATENAKDLLHNLTLLRNKVRQAGITQDIMEIISSAEALKGQ